MKSTKYWKWTFRNGLAVLQVPFTEDHTYTKEALTFAIANIKARRHTFADEEIYRLELSKFEEGLGYYK